VPGAVPRAGDLGDVLVLLSAVGGDGDPRPGRGGGDVIGACRAGLPWCGAGRACRCGADQRIWYRVARDAAGPGHILRQGTQCRAVIGGIGRHVNQPAGGEPAEGGPQLGPASAVDLGADEGDRVVVRPQRAAGPALPAYSAISASRRPGRMSAWESRPVTSLPSWARRIRFLRSPRPYATWKAAAHKESSPSPSETRGGLRRQGGAAPVPAGAETLPLVPAAGLPGRGR
jgi:hypothetical protein